jgi:hypothetical protein
LILEPEWLVLLASAAFLAGVLDTLAGGGGLITIPGIFICWNASSRRRSTPTNAKPSPAH